MGWFRDLGKNRPWAQGCVVAVAGCVLAASGCFGFVLSANSGSNLSEPFGMALGGLFVLGTLAVPVGGIWFLVSWLRQTLRKSPPIPPAPGPPAGPAPPAV